MRLGIGSRVDFVGKQENVNELLALSDLMLMPSEMESFGLAALEAMACRVPAVATRVGGVPELIDDGSNGLLYEVGDVDGMAAGALSILSDPAELERLSTAARRTAQDHFCASRIIPLYERYYERILAESSTYPR
jgi:glycosyltransferase involved in cell wall biosynthesis